MQITLESIYSEILSLQVSLTKPQKIAVTIQEAAKMIGVSKTTMYSLTQNNEIKYSIVGGRQVIKIKEIESYLSEREVSVIKRRK